MSNGGKYICWLSLSGVGAREWVKPRGRTQRMNIAMCTFDVGPVMPVSLCCVLRWIWLCQHKVRLVGVSGLEEQSYVDS